MTKDDIIRMAREADLWGEIYAMQRFAQLVAAAEREACAKLCEAEAEGLIGMAYEGIALGCAEAIRAKGAGMTSRTQTPEDIKKIQKKWLSKKEWVGLTKEERKDIFDSCDREDRGYVAAMVEAKLKEKNT